MGLTSLLGVFELVRALGTRPVAVAAVGLLGGVALAVAPWLPGLPWPGRCALLLVGTVPFAVLAWWSVAVAALALSALVVGRPGVGLLPGGTGRARDATTPRHGRPLRRIGLLLR